MVYNGKRFHFLILCLRFYQNKTGFEKGKATLSKCGYIIFGLTGVEIAVVETVGIAFDIEVVQNEILEAAKRYTTETDDFEILTQLQHYGGATNLIDFTPDYLIALFFSCDGSDLLNVDGRVILLQKTGEINEQVNFPQNPINRVIAQKSIFVQPAKGFIEPNHVINIPKDLKQPILNHLQKYHNISTNTIYNDLHGFIKYQNVHQSASAEFFKGLMSQKEKDYSKAIEHYSNAIKLNPQMVSAYNNRGAAYSDTGAYDCAIEDLSKAIELNPNDAKAYTNRGAAYSERSENDRAIEDLNKAITLNSNNAKAHNNRGLAYLSIGAYDRAIEDLNKAIELDPNDAEAYNNRGNAYGGTGEIDHAIKDLNKAIELDPNNAEAYNNRGIAYGSKGEIDQAIADYNKAIELNRDYAEAYNNRGDTYSDTGAYDRAIEDLNKAIELTPDDADTYNNRGVAYYRKGEVDWAIEDLNRAIELTPELALAYYNRGKAWLRWRKWNKAKTDLTLAKNMGMDIIAAFCKEYKNVAEFEQKYDVKLPEDIAVLLM